MTLGLSDAFFSDRKFVKYTIEPHHMFQSHSTTFSFNPWALYNQPESFTHFIFPEYVLVFLPLYFSSGQTSSSDNLFPLFQLSLFTNMCSLRPTQLWSKCPSLVPASMAILPIQFLYLIHIHMFCSAVYACFSK